MRGGKRGEAGDELKIPHTKIVYARACNGGGHMHMHNIHEHMCACHHTWLDVCGASPLSISSGFLTVDFTWHSHIILGACVLWVYERYQPARASDEH